MNAQNETVEGLLEQGLDKVDLSKLASETLEELAEVIRAKKNAPDIETAALEKIEAVLRALYKQYAENPDRETVPRVSAAKAGLQPIPVLPQPPPSVGDVNLVMTDVPLVTPPFSHTIIDVAKKLIAQTGGALPEMDIQYVVVGNDQEPRMIVRWEVQRAISADELHTLLQCARVAYEKDVTGFKSSGIGWKETGAYRNVRDVTDTPRRGLYMGPSNYYNAGASGLFVYRKFSSAAEAKLLEQKHPVDWLSRTLFGSKKVKTWVQLTESGKKKDGSGLSQDSFLMFVVQVAHLLRRRAVIESAPLWVEIYRELNKVGTKAIDRESLFGTEATLGVIERVTLLPYQEPELARLLHVQGESGLLVGVPGVGKTMLEHFLMASSYNALFVAVDSDSLRADLSKGLEDNASSVLMRVDRVIRRTTLPIILIIDDIDVILENAGVVSKFLNMMQGIRQKGLLILASTNYPERIDPRLLEPGRLSKVIHVPLPDEATRYGVLMTYLRHLPFVSEEQREKVAKGLVAKTKGWSHRYLWELVQDASRYCALDASSRLGRTVMEKDLLKLQVLLQENHFTRALPELLTRVGLADLEKWDTRITKFVENQTRVGFKSPA